MMNYLKTDYRCPLCQKSIPNDDMLQQIFERIRVEIAINPMPLEYRDKREDIICNDCGKKSNVPLHFIAMKCPECNSFNTKKY